MTATDTTARITLDISTDTRTHEEFVIIDALEEYASTHRWRAEDGDNAVFLNELADAADRLRAAIQQQLDNAR